MKCNKCNHELPEDSLFCQFCGEKFEKDVAGEIAIEKVEVDTFIQPKSERINKNLKLKFCKKCGGLIDAESKKCNSCGKQYFRFKKFLPIAIASIIIVISIGINIFQYFSYKSEVSKLNKEIETDNGVSKYKEDRIEDLQSSRLELIDEIYFYEANACIVPDDGTGIYHVYGCDYLGNYSYWIYNKEQAEYDYGYRPCPKCCR